MSKKSYQLGLEAGRNGLWFHETLDRYLVTGEVSREERLDFYRGYWGDLFNVSYSNGEFRMTNKKYRS